MSLAKKDKYVSSWDNWFHMVRSDGGDSRAPSAPMYETYEWCRLQTEAVLLRRKEDVDTCAEGVEIRAQSWESMPLSRLFKLEQLPRRNSHCVV